jgi:hypothetical protein
MKYSTTMIRIIPIIIASADKGTSGMNTTGATKQSRRNSTRIKKSAINQVTSFSDGLKGVNRGKCSLSI